MRVFLIVVVALAAVGHVQSQSLFSSLRNTFNRFTGNEPAPVRRPPPPGAFQPQPNQFQGQQFPQQQQFQQNPAPQFQQAQPAQQFQQGPPAQQFQQGPGPAPQGRSVNGCPPMKPNHFYNGEPYIVTFDHPAADGCMQFTGELADEYCIAQGGRAVSLDSNEKAEHFHGELARFAQRYMWTGGRIDHNAGVVTWPSSKREGYEHGKRYWSHTGGATPPRAQPDNRDGNEVCIGVLNNFYADGIKWHDVACHHKKPTVCEFPPKQNNNNVFRHRF